MTDSLDTRVVFTTLVGAQVLMRFVELLVARRNTGRLRRRGAFEAGASHYPWMVAVHAGFFPACVAEVWWLHRPMVPVVAGIALSALIAAAALRWWVVATLGERWSTRVMILPGSAPIRRGPFRFARHPNYVAVAVEFIALPLVHTAWMTAIVFSILNAIVLRTRIRIEEAALGHQD